MLNLKLPLYNTQKLLLSFEYGVCISETAKERGVELTPEMVKRAEEIIEKEFKSQTAEYCATHMVPNILAVFETN
jgi:hypothetical protein